MEKVFVLAIREGANLATDVFSTKQLALDAAAAYCINLWEDQWEEYSNLSDTEVIQYYVENDPNTDIWIVERTIDTDSQKFIN